jgi:hypothetical protein
MSTTHLDASRLVDAWSAVLEKSVPKPLRTAAANLEAVQWSQSPEVPFDAEKLTPATAEQMVIEHSQRLATAEQFNVARGQALAAAGRRVLMVAGEVIPDVFTQLQPRLKAASDALAAALDLLPDTNPSPEVLIGDVASVQAWHTAQAAVAELDALDRFVSSLSPVYGHQGEVTLRLLTPTTREAYQILLRAKDAKGALKPLWVAGATTPDVSWTLNDPAQSREIVAVLNALPPTERKQIKFARLSR